MPHRPPSYGVFFYVQTGGAETVGEQALANPASGVRGSVARLRYTGGWLCPS